MKKPYQRTLESTSLEVRSSEQSTVVLAGYAARYNDPTTLSSGVNYQVTEVIRPGAFKRAVEAGQDVRFLVNHDSNIVMGRTKAGTLKLRDDPDGLYFEATLPNTTAALDLAENIRLGNVSQCSFAFVPARNGGEKISTRVEGGVTYTDVEILDLDLYDVSAVTYPAYQSTSIQFKSRSQDLIETRKAEIVKACNEKLSKLRKV